jgi:hypothetical protein
MAAGVILGPEIDQHYGIDVVLPAGRWSSLSRGSAVWNLARFCLISSLTLGFSVLPSSAALSRFKNPELPIEARGRISIHEI